MAAAGLLIVTGLKREAAIFAAQDITAICGDAPTLRRELSRLEHLPLRLVVSAGICGGLDPSLRQGDVVIGTEIVSRGERIATDAATFEALAHHLGLAGERVVVGSLAAADAPIQSVEAKAKLRAATGAAAVDMESLIAGRYATERAVPFAILRAVSDPADRNLPPLALAASSPDGSINVAAVLRALIRRPGQLPSLLAAARDSAAAFRTLRRCRGFPGFLVGPGRVHLR